MVVKFVAFTEVFLMFPADSMPTYTHLNFGVMHSSYFVKDYLTQADSCKWNILPNHMVFTVRFCFCMVVHLLRAACMVLQSPWPPLLLFAWKAPDYRCFSTASVQEHIQTSPLRRSLGADAFSTEYSFAIPTLPGLCPH